jgi:hypothetical protein
MAASGVVRRFKRKRARMLERKPKLVALLVLLIALAVLLGQLSWALFEFQLSW